MLELIISFSQIDFGPVKFVEIILGLKNFGHTMIFVKKGLFPRGFQSKNMRVKRILVLWRVAWTWLVGQWEQEVGVHVEGEEEEEGV